MGHNLHLIRVVAKNGEEACDAVESQIMDWGTENNWRTMCGAVSATNQVFVSKDAINDHNTYSPKDMGITTIEKINNMVEKWIANNSYEEAVKEKLIKTPNIEKWSSMELYSYKRYIEHLASVKDWEESKKKSKKKPTFNVLTDEFRSYEYDECGVSFVESGDKGKVWIVFADIHS